jgi:hypothetical protein
MLNPNSTSGGLAYSEKSKVNNDNSKNADALNDAYENDEVETPHANPFDRDLAIANQKNDKERDVPESPSDKVKTTQTKPEKYDDLASSGT